MPESRLTNLTVDEMVRVAHAFQKAQVFKENREPMSLDKLFVIIMAGQELGLGPAAAVMGIRMIEGKPELSANLQAAAIKGSGKYDYRVEFDMEAEDPYCELTFFETATGTEIGKSRFAKSDAIGAGLWRGNYEKYPRNMLFARALSNGSAWIVPDAITMRTYHTGEITGEDIADIAAVAAAPDMEQITEGIVKAFEPIVPRETDGEKVPVTAGGPYDRPDEDTTIEVEGEEVDYFNPDMPPPPVVKPPPTVAAQQEIPLLEDEPVVTHEVNERSISPAQAKLLRVRQRAAKLTDDRMRAIVKEVTGQPHHDRVPFRLMDDMLRRLTAEAELNQE